MLKWLKDKLSKEYISDFDKQLLSSNLVGAKSLSELGERERILTKARESELKNTPIKGIFDYAHLKSINQHLFKDVYAWAGMDRYEIGIRGNFIKGDTKFTHGAELPKTANNLFDALKNENHFKNLNKDDFVKSMASFMNGVNILHPFREGNGRTQRIFIESLANNAGYKLDLSNVSKNIMILASIQAYKGNTKGLEIIIKDNLTEKTFVKEISQEKELDKKIKEFLKKRPEKSQDKTKDRGLER